MEAIKTIAFKERPIDLSVLYFKIKEIEKHLASLTLNRSILSVSTIEGVELIPQESILRCQADNNYTIIYLKDNSKLYVSKTLKYIFSQLCNRRFIRVHASHIVALEEVRKITTSKNKSLILTNGDCIPVSRTYQATLDWAFS